MGLRRRTFWSVGFWIYLEEGKKEEVRSPQSRCRGHKNSTSLRRAMQPGVPEFLLPTCSQIPEPMRPLGHQSTTLLSSPSVGVRLRGVVLYTAFLELCSEPGNLPELYFVQKQGHVPVLVTWPDLCTVSQLWPLLSALRLRSQSCLVLTGRACCSHI